MMDIDGEKRRAGQSKASCSLVKGREGADRLSGSIRRYERKGALLEVDIDMQLSGGPGRSTFQSFHNPEVNSKKNLSNMDAR